MRKLLGFVFAVAIPACAQFGPGGVFVCANCSNETTSSAQLGKEITIALQTAQVIDMMTREGISLAKNPNASMAADIGTVSAMLAQSQGVAGNLAQMNAMFQGTYTPFNPATAPSWAATYNNWAATTLRTLNGSIGAAGYTGKMMNNEQAWLAQIQSINNMVLGRNSSLQLGNTIGTAQVGQLQALRQLIATGNTAQAAYMANQVTAQQAQQNAQAAAFAPLGWSADGRKW